MTHSQKDKLLAALHHLGYRNDVVTTSKAVTLIYRGQQPNSGDLLFVGKSGSLRRGRIYTQSNVVPPHVKQQLLRKGEELLVKAKGAASEPRQARAGSFMRHSCSWLPPLQPL